MTDPAEGWHLFPSLAQNPLRRPKKTKKSPAPAFHAYALFVAAYRDAAEKLRAGVRNVVFPDGCFPPALPIRRWVGRRGGDLELMGSEFGAPRRGGGRRCVRVGCSGTNIGSLCRQSWLDL